MIVDAKRSELFDVVGGCVRFLASADETSSNQAFLAGVLPAGVVVPLHSHDDPESFFLLKGEMHLYTDDSREASWKVVREGELAVIPGGVKHAWWNRGTADCNALIVTGPALYAFFQEIAIPITEPLSPGAPDSGRIAAVTKAALAHGNTWLATPEENAAIGLIFPISR